MEPSLERAGGVANTALPPQQPPGSPASPTVPHRWGNGTGGEEWRGLSPPRSRVPASPPEVFPNPCSHGRRVGTRSSQAAGIDTAFPRSPASALPTPPAPPPRRGCNGDPGPRGQAVSPLHRAPSHPPPTALRSPAALLRQSQPAADAGSEEPRGGLFGVGFFFFD